MALIAWLNDYSMNEIQGGCNITSRIMMGKGRELGHTIKEYSAKDYESGGFKVDFSQFDLIILNNINAFKPEIIQPIIDNFKYVKYEHDYSFCEFRNGACDICKAKINPCTPGKIFIDLYSKSLLNIFFSPLQLSIYKKFFGETMRDAVVIPAPMEKGKWHPDKNGDIKSFRHLGIYDEIFILSE